MPNRNTISECSFCKSKMRSDNLKKHIARMHSMPPTREIVFVPKYGYMIIPSADDVADYESGKKTMEEIHASWPHLIN
jgi:hypothetical protein